MDAAVGRDDAREAILRLYADVQHEIDVRRPVCVMSGRCCRFEDFGHRLYVTTLELASFVHGVRRATVPAGGKPWDGTGCPFQSNKLCGVHAIRPFGCRMFFCDATATDWQNETYERFHTRLKVLHDELAVPYYYVEWRQALNLLGLADAGAAGAG